MRRSDGIEVIDAFNQKADSCWDEYISTGFPQLDTAMGGGLSVGLTILGALSALGKTTLMEQIATNISSRGRDVLFITLEMRKKQIAAKAISRQSYLQGGKDIAFTSGELQKENIIKHLNHNRNLLYQKSCNAVKFQWTNFSLISNQDKLWTVSEIEKYVQKEWIAQGYLPPVIFIDYLQLTPYEDTRETNDMKIIGNISSNLKALSSKFKTPVMVISSINRASYNEPLSMSCFKGSGNIEFNADVLLGIQLAGVGQGHFDMEKEKHKEIRNVEIKVLKVKERESGATIPMDYYAKFNYFKECDVKEEGKRGEKMRTADRPAPAKKRNSENPVPQNAKKIEQKDTQKERALKKIQEEREMRNAVKRELEEGLKKNPIPEPPEWVKRTLLPV